MSSNKLDDKVASNKAANNKISNTVLAILLLLFSPWANAAALVPWKTYLAGVMFIALVTGTFLSIRNKKAEGRMAKIIMAGVYFWLITFAELIILALVYHFFRRAGF